MKKVLLVIGLVALLTGPAWAGGLGPMISYWSTEDLDDDTGFGAKFEVDVNDNWDVELRGSQLEGYELRRGELFFELEAFPVDLGLAYNFNPGGTANGYLGFGGTYVLLDADTLRGDQVVSARMKDEFGFYVVAGLEVAMTSKLSLFAEGMYREAKGAIQGDDINSAFVDQDVDLTGPGAQVGLMLAW